MTTVLAQSSHPEPRRREGLYRGDLYTYAPRPSTLALTQFAASMLEEAFAPLDPILAQHEMTVERFVEIFAPVKPRFIHHPRTMEILRALVIDLGCDPEQTYLDVPRLRGVTSDGYLTAGVGFAHHPHRDTWWSAPMQQLNWWLPIYEMAAESSMSFHLDYFGQPVANTSEEFDYFEWNAVGRAEAAKHVHTDTRRQPVPVQEIDLARAEMRFVLDPGGLLIFSPTHLHSTVPNTTGKTRFSIDFRTVNIADVRAGHGAANVDSRPSGTSLRDFFRVSDGAPMPEDALAPYDDGDLRGGVARFTPEHVRR